MHLGRVEPHYREAIQRVQDHDGRYPTLMSVVEHYDSCLDLDLTAPQKRDLVQYLRSQ
jgi:hypothetical protein